MDLLDISTILQGKLTLKATNVDLETVVLSAIETMALAAQAKSIQVITVFEPNLETVLGDSTRLQQVVWNLLSNAVKFTPNGGKVEVRLIKADGYAQIIVSDTGKGISAEFLPYAFDYFRQADSSSTRKFGGLGLGLAIVRNIVEMHGGTVTAQSQGEDQGATFTVKLPLLEEENQNLIAEQYESSGLKPYSYCLTGMQILVVDDDRDSLDFVAFVLEEDGADVVAVSSALEALQVIEQQKPDVLVSDIGMPDMDGYTLIRQLRTWSTEQGGEIPAIALTAFASKRDREKALEL